MTQFCAKSILVLSFLVVSIDSVVGQDVMTAEAVVQKTGSQLQQTWLSASEFERVRIAEGIGEDGAREFAKSKGYTTLYDGLQSKISQGPDQVYRALDGRVIVFEAKGGTGQLGHAYGHAQGTSEWAVESAKRVFTSPKVGAVEKAAAQEILKAAAQGTLHVHVIRTSHVLGEPVAAVLESVAATSDDATRLARAALAEVTNGVAQVTDEIARSADDVGRASAKGSLVLKTAAKLAIPLAVAFDAGLRVADGINLEREFASGEITVQQRETAHVKNATGMAGGLAGAWVGVKLGTLGGGAAGTAVAPGPGTAIGGVVGGLAGGVAGYIGGEAAAEVAAEWAMETVHSTGTTIADTASSIADGVRSTWNWTWGY